MTVVIASARGTFAAQGNPLVDEHEGRPPPRADLGRAAPGHAVVADDVVGPLPGRIDAGRRAARGRPVGSSARRDTPRNDAFAFSTSVSRRPSWAARPERGDTRGARAHTSTGRPRLGPSGSSRNGQVRTICPSMTACSISASVKPERTPTTKPHSNSPVPEERPSNGPRTAAARAPGRTMAGVRPSAAIRARRNRVRSPTFTMEPSSAAYGRPYPSTAAPKVALRSPKSADVALTRSPSSSGHEHGTTRLGQFTWTSVAPGCSRRISLRRSARAAVT